MAEYKIPVYGVVGPTASGKTALAVEVCKALGAEAVSCDSMQVYKGMDIATAKPTAEEMQGVRHHLIDFLDPGETYSVARYCDDAKRAIEDIHSRGLSAVIVGGTGLYYSSLADNIRFFEEESDMQYRRALYERAEKEGAEALLDELKKIDPERAVNLHPNNLGRVIRALEIYHTTGRTITLQNLSSKREPAPYELITVCLNARDRDVLYSRINARVDAMVKNGLVDEARSFFESGAGSTAVQAIGYKELKPYFDGTATLDECLETLKMQTRRYAKRQLTWFRRDERIKQFYIDDYGSLPELTGAVLEYFSERRGEIEQQQTH